MSALDEKQEVFSFVVRVAGIDPEDASHADRLFEAGCDDAIVFLQNNQLFVEFDRHAKSYEAAVESATRNIEAAGGSILFVEKNQG
jgi:hypothetical protein